MIEAIPFRVRVGVTGHRSLENPETIRKQIQHALKNEVLSLFDPDSFSIIGSAKTTPIYFTAITALAEGADRLVAQEILGLAGGKISAVIPLPVEEYLKDFKTEDSRAEFQQFYDRSRNPVPLNKEFLTSNREGSSPEGVRKQAYYDAGIYIVEHCDVLIAIWDGLPARGKGGTAEIVEYALRRERPVIIISADASKGIEIKPGHGLNARAVPALDMFNSLKFEGADEKISCDEAEKDIFKCRQASAIPEERRGMIRDRLLPYYVRASALAEDNQKRYMRSGFWVYFLAAFSIAAIAAGFRFSPISDVMFGLELFCLAAILTIVMFSHRRQYHKNWIECRFLAERLRSGMYFAACGNEPSPIDILPFLGLAHQPNDWMVIAFDEIWSRLPAFAPCKDTECADLSAFIRECWIKDQIDYHSRKAIKTGKKSRGMENWGKWIFLLALVAVFIHLVIIVLGRGFGKSTNSKDVIENMLAFLALALPGIGMAVTGVRSHREYTRLEKRSRNMEFVLKNLFDRYTLIQRPSELSSLLRETETIMLQETQDWLMLMKFANIEIV